MTLGIGDIIDGKYRIVSLLGEGGMGSVYEGENLRIHRRVAIKVLHSHIAESTDATQRFEREAQAAGRIGSEHIVEVLDLGELSNGDHYMVMEFLEGEPLTQRILNRGKMLPQNVARITLQLLEGLHAAHAAGIVHRDLKPDNVFLLSTKRGSPDFVKILDFGISKFNTLGGEFSMTRTGAVMGTPYYLSPEQAKGERSVDARSDLYGVGVIMWEACAGRVPFDGATFNELLFKIVLEPIPTLHNAVPDVDDAFVAIVEKAMAREPEARFQTAREMQSSLREWLDAHPATAATERPPQTIGNSKPVVRFPAVSTPTDFGPGTPVDIHGTRAQGTNEAALVVSPRVSAGKANAPAKRSPAGRVGLWVIAALLAGVGGYSWVAFREASANRAAQARAAERAAQKEAEQARQAEATHLEAERIRAKKQKAEAEQAQSEAARLRAQVEREAALSPRSTGETGQFVEEQQATPSRTIAPRPPTAPALPDPGPASTEPSPSPQPEPRPKGRRIRTEL